MVIPSVIPNIIEEQPIQEQPLHEEQINTEPLIQNLNEPIGVRSSTREKKSAMSSDYLVYLQESDFDVGPKAGPSSFSQAMNGINSKL